jgi:DNA-binding MurR/RpiR family transcriptional regulator
MSLPDEDVFIVVEDSHYYGQEHKRHLEKFGLDAVVLRGIGNFTEQIAEIKKTKNVVGIITDGLHGEWVHVHEAAMTNGIEKIWLISGNEQMMQVSKYFPYTQSISKHTLHQNPDQYKMFLEAVKH